MGVVAVQYAGQCWYAAGTTAPCSPTLQSGSNTGASGYSTTCGKNYGYFSPNTTCGSCSVQPGSICSAASGCLASTSCESTSAVSYNINLFYALCPANTFSTSGSGYYPCTACGAGTWTNGAVGQTSAIACAAAPSPPPPSLPPPSPSPPSPTPPPSPPFPPAYYCGAPPSNNVGRMFAVSFPPSCNAYGTSSWQIGYNYIGFNLFYAIFRVNQTGGNACPAGSQPLSNACMLFGVYDPTGAGTWTNAFASSVCDIGMCSPGAGGLFYLRVGAAGPQLLAANFTVSASLSWPSTTMQGNSSVAPYAASSFTASLFSSDSSCAVAQVTVTEIC